MANQKASIKKQKQANERVDQRIDSLVQQILSEKRNTDEDR